MNHAKYFNEPALDPVFSYLALGNTQTGKLVFAKSLNLIDKDTVKFIKRLSAIRNKFAHKVAYVNLELKDFFDDLNQNAQKDYRQELLFGHQPKKKIQIKHDKELYSAKAIMQLFSVAVFDYVPKLSIWFGAIICLSSIYNHIALAEIRVQKQELDEQIVGFLTDLLQSSQNLDGEQKVVDEDE